MESNRCAACRCAFRPRPQVPRQRYCTAIDCQRERRRQWQKVKRQNDPDYRENQEKAQRAWCARNPDYWRNFRKANPDYCERNRAQQRVRRGTGSQPAVAKMDASAPAMVLPTGIYRIIPESPDGIAKMDSWTVEITLISATSNAMCGRCKERM